MSIELTDGFTVLDMGTGTRALRLRSRFLAALNTLSLAHGEHRVRTDADVRSLYTDRHDIWSCWYQQLPFIPGVLAFAPRLTRMARTIGGLRSPALCGWPVVRVDMPGDRKHILGPHQDWPFHHGSLNSLTFWMPLQDIDGEIGPLGIAPGTHKVGVSSADSDGLIESPTDAIFRPVPMRQGEVAIFSQFLVHRSGINASDRIRFSVQFRFNDLADEDYLGRLWYMHPDQRFAKSVSV